ncbi:MAG: peptidase [Sphingomonas bacterium]|nr:M23 family metallopeptidase [Sphingomonas bacterium]MDB5690380.1 peptidase [Sphingomonas bacterium]
MSGSGRGARLGSLGLLTAAMAGCSAIPAAAPPPPAPIAAPPPLPAPVQRADPGRSPRAFVLDGAITQGGLVRGTAPAGTIALTLDGQPVALAADGRFLFGFGRDAGPSSRLEARLDTGERVAMPLAVIPRRWDIQSLPTLPRGTTPTPEFVRRRAAETAQIAAARDRNSATDGWRQRFIWPVTGRISGVFGSQRIYAGEPGAPHAGLDIARPIGTPVAAPADGVVVLAAAAPFSLEGNLLMIDHGMGLNSAFLHLSRIDVKVGDRVVQGQAVGAIGMTGRATGPHLHWALRWREARVDPQPLLPPMPAPTL